MTHELKWKYTRNRKIKTEDIYATSEEMVEAEYLEFKFEQKRRWIKHSKNCIKLSKSKL